MPSFEINGPDGVYEVIAPDERSAAAAFKKMQVAAPKSDQQAPSKSMSVPVTDAMGAPVGQTEIPGGAAPSYGDQMSKIGGVINSSVRMAANGATFGLADKLAGGMDYLSGSAPSYGEGVSAQRAATQAIRDANPMASGAAEAAGGIAGGAGLVRGGLTLAGRVGAGLLPRVAGYGAEGAAYGAAHGAGNTYSDKIGDYFGNAGTGAALGSMVGAGLPVVGSGAGAAYRTAAAFLGPRVDGAGRGASALLRGAAQADEAGLRGLGQLGPEAMLPDAGPAMLGLAQGAATGTGAGRSELINALQARDRTTAQRLAQSLDRNLGPSPVPSQIDAGIGDNLATTGARYDQPIQNAMAVNTQPIANRLDAIAVDLRGPAQQAVRRVREYLNIPGTDHLDPNPNALFQTRQAIDGLLAGEANPQVTRQLTIARQHVDTELARAAPGIKNVDADYSELMRQRAALDRGGQVLDGGKTAIRPVELAQELQRGALPQGLQVGPSGAPTMLRHGVRADIDRRVGTNINDLGALERTFGTPQDWNHQKLGMVFGDGPRDAVASDITANRLFRDTHQKVTQNSQTAQRMEAADAMKGAAGGNIPADITATGLGLKAINGIAKILSGQSNMNTRDEVGQLLSQQGPAARRLAQQLLGSAQTTGSNARSIAALLSSPRWIAASSPELGRR